MRPCDGLLVAVSRPIVCSVRQRRSWGFYRTGRGRRSENWLTLQDCRQVIVIAMETERNRSMKSLNELLWVFMRQAAIEGAAQMHAARRQDAAKVRAERHSTEVGKS